MRDLSELSPKERRRHRTRRRRLIVGSGTVVALLAVGGVAMAMTNSMGDQYRTTTVTRGSVDQTVSATGTIESASRADASFSTAGTVDTIKVAVGDKVEAGALLATLDASELQSAVDDAEESLATAKQTLSDDLDAQSSSSSTSTSASNASTSSSSTSSSSTNATTAAYSTSTTEAAATSTAVSAVYSTTAASTTATTVASSTSAATAAANLAAAKTAFVAAQQAVKDAQDTLLDQYDLVTNALTASAETVAASTGSDGVCASFLAALNADSGSSGTNSAELASLLTDCQSAIVAAGDNQTEVDTAQQALLDYVDTLDAKVTALRTAADKLATAAAAGSSSGGSSSGGSGGSSSGGTPSGTPSGGTPSGTPSGGTPSGTPSGGTPSGTPSGGTPSGTPSGDTGMPNGTTSPNSGLSGSAAGGGATTTITAARILADRAAVNVAKSDLAIAEAAADRGDLTAPISGTVGEITMKEGAEVSASDSSAVITILGDKGYTMSATLNLSDIKLLSVGQTFTATTTASTVALTGEVSSIGLTNQSSTSTPSYTVTLAVDTPKVAPAEGASASVTIAVASHENVLVVPTSAVTTSSGSSTVKVLKNGVATATKVEVGAVGPELTEITSGLKEGEVVVLADLTQAIVSSDSSESSGLSGLSGGSDSSSQSGFPGGGMPPSGMGGFPSGMGGAS